MPLLLPNLDDRTWSDLTAEAVSLLPVYGPQWTDQNYSDPGITLFELNAAIAEMDIFWLNQVSNRDRQKYAALVGVTPRPGRPAHAVVSLSLGKGTNPLFLPRGLEFCGKDAFGVATPFTMGHDITVAPGAIAAIQSQDSCGYHDLTPQWTRNAVLNPFGTGPQPGMAFYIGLTDALRPGHAARLFFTCAGDDSGPEERERLHIQAEEAARPCGVTVGCRCSASQTTTAEVSDEPERQPLVHYGVRTQWQYLADVAGNFEWVALDAAAGDVVDDTRAFTLDGAVTVRLPGDMALATVGAVSQPHYYIRSLPLAGRYDAAPALQDVAFNGALLEQVVPASSTLTIVPGTAVTVGRGGPPQPDSRATMSVQLDGEGRIVELALGQGATDDPRFVILDFEPPAVGKPGKLCIEAAFLGFGMGFPRQQVTLPAGQAEPADVDLYTLESGAWLRWRMRPDFLASTRSDRHAVLDAAAGTIRFGNGEKGRVPPSGCLIFASFRLTRAQAGNLAAGQVNDVADSAHNRALLKALGKGSDPWSTVWTDLDSTANPLPARGGAADETLDQALARADARVATSGRAVTLDDYERLAKKTPGTGIARVKAIADLHPDFPCFKAPGMITVIVLPYLPKGSPMPTPGLLNAVERWLRPRRVIGTRVAVTGPTYLNVAVQATVQSVTGASKTAVQQAIIAAVNKFFDPLTGGPDGTGWPFGRQVYRAEMMKIIDSVAGVDFISALALVADGGQPQCGNVCLGPTWLVQAGTHQITVL